MEVLGWASESESGCLLEERLFFLEQFLRLGGRLRRGGLFPEAPDGNFAEAERVPPEVQHGLIEIEDSAASDSFGRGNEGGEAGVDLSTLGAGGAREKMP